MLLIQAIGVFAVYIVVFYFARKYRNRSNTPISWWKIIITCIVGLISVTIPFEFFDAYHSFALFPLGAFVFYIFTRKTHWHTYRPFIWIGFFANYAFFIVSIVTVPIENAFYPPDRLTTYTNSVNYAQVVTSHTSGEVDMLLIDDPNMALITHQQQEVAAEKWYYDYTETQHFYTEEEFPYLLTDYQKRSGMTKPYSIFVNKTGDGLLVITEKHQYYFTLEKSILQLGGEGDA